MTWEKTNSSLGSKRETAIAFAEWLWEFQTGEVRDMWKKFEPWFPTETDEDDEEKSTEQMYNRWNKLNNQETN